MIYFKMLICPTESTYLEVSQESFYLKQKLGEGNRKPFEPNTFRSLQIIQLAQGQHNSPHQKKRPGKSNNEYLKRQVNRISSIFSLEAKQGHYETGSEGWRGGPAIKQNNKKKNQKI